MDIKNNLSAILAGIILIFAFPIPFAEVIQEENPEDSTAKQLSKASSIEFTVEQIPRNAISIILWTSDTLRAPLDTVIVLRTGNTTTHTTLKKIRGNERKLVTPIYDNASSLSMNIQTPALDNKKAILLRTQQKNRAALAYSIMVRKPFIQAILEKLYAQQAIAGDIEYVWKEGGEILKGKNPYTRATGNIKNGSKYATYFPLSYIISAGIQKMGFASFDSWMKIVRPIILISQLISATLVLYYLARKGKLAMGLFAFFIILFHRFTLYPARVTHIDFPAIALLLAGMMLLRKKPGMAYTLIGISLAIKQMAMFMIPALLIYAWHQKKSAKKVTMSFLLMALVPIVTLTPFIIDNPKGTAQSILFSVERAATGDFASPDLATTLALDGIWGRIPMLGMFLLVYLACWRREMHLFGATLAIFTIFAGFNPVLFFQYLAWVIPFVPLAISEATLSGSPSQSFRQLRDT